MKNWKKPTVKSLCAKDLTAYIKVAARTGICLSCDFR